MGSWTGRSFQWQDKITVQYSVPMVERCPAEEERSRWCLFSSNLLSSSWPKGFPVLLLPKQQVRALFLQVFFLPGCTLSMDKLASLFYPVCFFASNSRRATGASHIPVEWMEKKPQMWLLWTVRGKRSGSAVSSDWLEDVQAERFLLISLWVSCQDKGAAGFGFV